MQYYPCLRIDIINQSINPPLSPADLSLFCKSFQPKSKHSKAKNEQGPVSRKNMQLFSSSDVDDDNDADYDDGTDDDDDDDFLGSNKVRQSTGGSLRLAWTF